MANGIKNGAAATSSARRPWAILALLVIVALVVGGFLALRPRRIRVQVIKPERQAILSTITTNGKVEPRRNFEAHALAASTVKRVLVHAGDSVQTGQLLVQLDDAASRADLARATAQLRAAQASEASLHAGGSQEELLTRQASLSKTRAEVDAANRNLQALTRLEKSGAASPAEVSVARDRLNRAQADLRVLEQQQTQRFSRYDRERVAADVANAEAAVKAARDQIENANVRAPFAGTVYSLPIREGAYVSVGDLLVQVADLTQVQVRAFVDEPEMGRLQLGQAVKVTWDAVPGRTWTGKVMTLPASVISRGSRMVGEVLCSVDNQDGRLLPSVNVAAVIVTADTANALTLPREALHDEGSQRVVYVVRDGRLQQRTVKTGVANLTRIEITQGLSENDTVALASLSPSPLIDGATVKIAP